jgi:hypothetical protein
VVSRLLSRHRFDCSPVSVGGRILPAQQGKFREKHRGLARKRSCQKEEYTKGLRAAAEIIGAEKGSGIAGETAAE